MFVGRQEELATLSRLYRRSGFEMVVLYGRRRVGKTSLIDEFTKDKQTLYFTALQQSSHLNLRAFSSAIAEFFDLPAETPAFASWQTAFTFIAKQARIQLSNEPFVFVFDEFPYAAIGDTSLPSALQLAIDHEFKGTNVMMILSGSNEGFIESKVLGGKSPLFGRRTAQIKLQPFDFLDAAKFLPHTKPEDLVNYYATFGGTPYYLAQLDESTGFEQNVFDLCFSKFGILYEEPMMLLREELREPATYYSALQAIASGNSTPKAIAEHAGIEISSIGRYLKTLESLGLVQRKTPYGENPDTSRKGAYAVTDPFFAYWFRFVGPHSGAIESGVRGAAAKRLAFGQAFSTYVGQQFETICLQWLARANAEDRLPFLATQFGKWWGTNPAKREQTDIDVIAGDPQSKTILLGECKWRNSLNETEAINALQERVGLVKGYGETYLALFSKTRVSEATRAKYPHRFLFVSADDLYK